MATSPLPEVEEAQAHLLESEPTAGGGEMLQALMTQSAALATLVGHLMQGGGMDPLLDAISKVPVSDHVAP